MYNKHIVHQVRGNCLTLDERRTAGCFSCFFIRFSTIFIDVFNRQTVRTNAVLHQQTNLFWYICVMAGKEASLMFLNAGEFHRSLHNVSLLVSLL